MQKGLPPYGLDMVLWSEIQNYEICSSRNQTTEGISSICLWPALKNI